MLPRSAFQWALSLFAPATFVMGVPLAMGQQAAPAAGASAAAQGSAAAQAPPAAGQAPAAGTPAQAPAAPAPGVQPISPPTGPNGEPDVNAVDPNLINRLRNPNAGNPPRNQGQQPNAGTRQGTNPRGNNANSMNRNRANASSRAGTSQNLNGRSNANSRTNGAQSRTANRVGTGLNGQGTQGGNSAGVNAQAQTGLPSADGTGNELQNRFNTEPMIDLGMDLEFSAQGLVVGDLAANSLGDRGGFIGGDVIQKIDGQPVTSFASLNGILANHEAGDRISVDVLRNGTLETVSLTLPNNFDPQSLMAAGGEGSGQAQGDPALRDPRAFDPVAFRTLQDEVQALRAELQALRGGPSGNTTAPDGTSIDPAYNATIIDDDNRPARPVAPAPRSKPRTP